MIKAIGTNGNDFEYINNLLGIENKIQKIIKEQKQFS